MIKEISLTMLQVPVNASFRLFVIVFDQISSEYTFIHVHNWSISAYKQTSIASNRLAFQHNVLQSKNKLFFGAKFFSRSSCTPSSIYTWATYTQFCLGRPLSYSGTSIQGRENIEQERQYFTTSPWNAENRVQKYDAEQGAFDELWGVWNCGWTYYLDCFNSENES